MRKYVVAYSQTYYSTIEVDAYDPEDACDVALEMVSKPGENTHILTVDYWEPEPPEHP